MSDQVKLRNQGTRRRAPLKLATPAIRKARSLPPDSQARALALLAAQAGLDKKARGVDIVDVTGKVDYADFLVLMTGQSDRHVAAIARGVDEDLSKRGYRPLALEGLAQSQWVLIDFVDVVVHVFQEDARRLYNLDGLWMDAGRLPVPKEPRPEGRTMTAAGEVPEEDPAAFAASRAAAYGELDDADADDDSSDAAGDDDA